MLRCIFLYLLACCIFFVNGAGNLFAADQDAFNFFKSNGLQLTANNETEHSTYLFDTNFLDKNTFAKIIEVEETEVEESENNEQLRASTFLKDFWNYNANRESFLRIKNQTSCLSFEQHRLRHSHFPSLYIAHCVFRL